MRRKKSRASDALSPAEGRRVQCPAGRTEAKRQSFGRSSSARSSFSRGVLLLFCCFYESYSSALSCALNVARQFVVDVIASPRCSVIAVQFFQNKRKTKQWILRGGRNFEPDKVTWHRCYAKIILL